MVYNQALAIQQNFGQEVSQERDYHAYAHAKGVIHSILTIRDRALSSAHVSGLRTTSVMLQ